MILFMFVKETDFERLTSVNVNMIETIKASKEGAVIQFESGRFIFVEQSQDEVLETIRSLL